MGNDSHITSASVKLGFVGDTESVVFTLSAWTGDSAEWGVLILFRYWSCFVLARSRWFVSLIFIELGVPRRLLNARLIIVFNRSTFVCSCLNICHVGVAVGIDARDLLVPGRHFLVITLVRPPNFNSVWFAFWAQFPGINHHEFEVLIVVNRHGNVVVVFNKFL